MQLETSAPLESYTQALSTDSSKLLNAAKSDGLSYVKVTQPGTTQGIIASVPARCWVAAGSAAQLTIHTLDSGSLVAASLSAPCPAVTDSKVELNLPTLDSAQVMRPMPAPQLSLPVAPAGQAPGVQQPGWVQGDCMQQAWGGCAPGRTSMVHTLRALQQQLDDLEAQHRQPAHCRWMRVKTHNRCGCSQGVGMGETPGRGRQGNMPEVLPSGIGTHSATKNRPSHGQHGQTTPLYEQGP